MTPAASEVQLHPCLTILVGLMTPFHVRDDSRAAPCLRAPNFSHGAIGQNVNWLTPGSRKAPAVGVGADIARMHGLALCDFLTGLPIANNLLPIRLSVGRDVRCAICPGS
jgi:hypothetical protein